MNILNNKSLSRRNKKGFKDELKTSKWLILTAAEFPRLRSPQEPLILHPETAFSEDQYRNSIRWGVSCKQLLEEVKYSPVQRPRDQPLSWVEREWAPKEAPEMPSEEEFKIIHEVQKLPLSTELSEEQKRVIEKFQRYSASVEIHVDERGRVLPPGGFCDIRLEDIKPEVAETEVEAKVAEGGTEDAKYNPDGTRRALTYEERYELAQRKLFEQTVRDARVTQPVPHKDIGLKILSLSYGRNLAYEMANAREIKALQWELFGKAAFEKQEEIRIERAKLRAESEGLKTDTKGNVVETNWWQEVKDFFMAMTVIRPNKRA